MYFVCFLILKTVRVAAERNSSRSTDSTGILSKGSVVIVYLARIEIIALLRTSCKILYLRTLNWNLTRLEIHASICQHHPQVYFAQE